MTNLERTLVKISHVVRHTFRRTSFIKFLVFILVATLVYVTMSGTLRPPGRTVYEYYNIVKGSNEGLSATDPSIFKLNGKNLTITSGTIHYFRVHPKYWRKSLRKLRALGAIAVETYAPWNLHEPYKDVYDFGEGNFEMSDFLDVVTFIEMAKEEDLLVIFRPGPYICAEWDFGGLPSYLLGDGAMVRTSHPKYMARVEKYFSKLLPLVAPLQTVYGGPIIMFQIENEYGSLRSPDHEYMVQLKQIMNKYGVKGLMFTADSPEPSLDSGALPEFDVLQTANFKEDGLMQMRTLRQLQPHKPILVTEFWTGWFDHWDKPVHNTFPTADYIGKLKEILEFPASVNLYVFHGGTSFGFLNGANNDDTEESYHPDTSSYDYDAPLTEAGDYTIKYSATLELFHKVHPHLDHPLPPPLEVRKLALKIPFAKELPWAQIVAQLPTPKGELVNRKDFIYMEDLPPMNEQGWKQNFGFVRYTRGISVVTRQATLRLSGRVRDLAVVLVGNKWQSAIVNNGMEIKSSDFTLWAANEYTDIQLDVDPGNYTLEVLVENCGRINYVKTLEWIMQKKGLGADNEISWNNSGGTFTTGINVTGMPFLSSWVKSLTGWQDRVTIGEKHSPSLVKATFHLRADQISDTFLNIAEWKRGIVYVNDFNIGRYFSPGPQLAMFIPAPLLKVGENTITIFELYFNGPNMQLDTEPSFR